MIASKVLRHRNDSAMMYMQCFILNDADWLIQRTGYFTP